MKKRYTAVVCGMLSQQKGIIDIPIGADYDNRPMQMVDEKHGKRAVTRYEAVGNDGRYTRLHLFPETGRTHQLRVHCAYFGGLNAPIRGDRLYGNAADRLYLHADTITFSHPATGKSMTFCSPVPF